MKTALTLLMLLIVLEPASSSAATFYVDPAAGSMSGDGSAAAPWSTLQEVVEGALIETREWSDYPYDATRTLVEKNAGAPVKGGDTLRLLTGYHGQVEIIRAYNADHVTVEAEPGHVPTLGRLLVQAASGWTFRGLTITPEQLPSYDPGTIVQLQSQNWSGPSSNILLEECEIYSVDDTSGWSETDWDTLAATGIDVSGDEITVRGNLLRNVNFGISVTGATGLVEYNTVDGFAGDGLRGLGDHGVFQFNLVKNCYDVNDNHDDGFQSWSRGSDGTVGEGEVTGVVLNGNTFINYEDPLQPFRGTLQGIGCFDGFFTDWVVENNVVITDHWHGITLLGALNSRVVNNTVIDLNADSPGPPWISIDDHKTRGPSTGSLVRNNLTTALNLGANVVEDHNIVVDMVNLGEHFTDAANRDLRLVSTSGAVDAGTAEYAPSRDRDDIYRPQGDQVDVGAYEWFEGEPFDPAETDTDTPSGGDDGDCEGDDCGTNPNADSGCSCGVVGKPNPNTDSHSPGFSLVGTRYLLIWANFWGLV